MLGGVLMCAPACRMKLLNHTCLVLFVYKQAEAVVKVDSTKEVLKMPRWVSVAASERFTEARAGTTGKDKLHTAPALSLKYW